MARTRPWEVSDALWARVEPLIPARPAHPKGGRPANDDRQLFAAIVYVLRILAFFDRHLQPTRSAETAGTGR